MMLELDFKALPQGWQEMTDGEVALPVVGEVVVLLREIERGDPPVLTLGSLAADAWGWPVFVDQVAREQAPDVVAWAPVPAVPLRGETLADWRMVNWAMAA